MVDLTNENSDATDLVTQLMVIQPKKNELLFLRISIKKCDSDVHQICIYNIRIFTYVAMTQ